MRNSEQKTRLAFLWTSLLKAPFWALYGLLVFILYKDLHASHFQVAVFLALKPVVSILSIYWSAYVRKRRDRLVPNIIVGGLLGYVPFFFFPFVSSPWFFIFSGVLYMLLKRGIIPAWMEIFKIHMAPVSREKVFALGSAISYIGGIVFPILIGDLLDMQPGAWRYLFPALAVLGLSSTLFQLRIPIPACEEVEEPPRDFKKFITEPWKNAWDLCRRRPDFRLFQWGFFLGGGGLMLMQPALPHFFFESLQISYTELAVALSACKGVGFAMTTRFWSNLMHKIPIFKMCALVTAIAALFPVLLLFAKGHLFWLYAGYIIYGAMQAGSELSWHLSGPVFSRNEDSSPYSSVNVAAVGIRGCIAPFVGSFLCAYTHTTVVLLLGGLLCLIATYQMQRWQKTTESMVL
ncbi:MAG: MFS transporter [Verrucomicrobia bacterium]|nr:MFS transporter [Verrucomicrobiota bacterium]